MNKTAPALIRYTLPILAVIAAYLVRVVLEGHFGPGLPTYVTYFPVIMIVAVVWGLKPGLLATVAAAVTAYYYQLTPHGAFEITTAAEAIGLAIFLLTGVFMSVVASYYLRLRTSLNEMVTERTAALTMLNEQLRNEAIQRQQAEESLAESRAKNKYLAELLEAAEQPFAVGYPDGAIGYVNGAFEQLTGYSRQELAQLDWSTTITPPEWSYLERTRLADLHSSGQAVRYEKEYIRKDGSRVPIELLVHMMRDEQGSLLYYYSFITDLTERKRAELSLYEANEELTAINEELRQQTVELACANEALKNAQDELLISEERFRTMFERHQAIMLLIDPQSGAIVDANSSAAAFYGFSHEELTTKKIQEINLLSAEKVAAERELAVTENRNYFVFPHRLADGLIRWVEVYSSPVLIHDTQLLFSIIHDITERKQLDAERQKFVYLIENSSEFIGMCDMNLVPFFINRSGLEQIGLDTLEEAFRVKVPDFLFPEDQPFIKEEFLPKVLQYGHGEVEIRFRHFRTGEPVWMLCNVFYLRDTDGSPVGLATVSRNVTERNRDREKLELAHALLERQVKERTAELENALKSLESEMNERLHAVEELRQKERLMSQQSRLAAMGEMISNIAHQWRQPLNTLGLLIQRLPIFYGSDIFNREFVVTTSADAMKLIQHMSTTIDDFRDFFKPEKEQTRFNVAKAIHQAVDLVAVGFRAHNLQVELELDGNPSIYGYPNEFSQVIMNILLNSRDALLERGVEQGIIHIQAGKENNRVYVTIRDNGGGIPEEIIDRIFEPYFTTKGPDRGTGIGLFMAKSIIEQNHGGILSARNCTGGAEFRIEVLDGVQHEKP